MPWIPLPPADLPSLPAHLQCSRTYPDLLLYRDPYSCRLYVLHNRNPLSAKRDLTDATVIHLGEHPVLAIDDAHFALATGDCLELPSMTLPVVPTRHWNDQLEIYLPSH
ncbi:nitrite reductase (NAD(P)H) small subunit [Marinobacter hydrocarbonoclasticus]|nr:nitrite reductase (NAD(P)H) small subunit [Marinobacter nauticus]